MAYNYIELFFFKIKTQYFTKKYWLEVYATNLVGITLYKNRALNYLDCYKVSF